MKILYFIPFILFACDEELNECKRNYDKILTQLSECNAKASDIADDLDTKEDEEESEPKVYYDIICYSGGREIVSYKGIEGTEVEDWEGGFTIYKDDEIINLSFTDCMSRRYEK